MNKKEQRKLLDAYKVQIEEGNFKNPIILQEAFRRYIQ